MLAMAWGFNELKYRPKAAEQMAFYMIPNARLIA